MGSSSSKFRKYLQNGDEYAALQTFQSSTELQHSLDPNSSYGDSLKHNTPLHLAAQHAIRPLLRIFLTELKGNPNKQNSLGETPLHLVCQGDSRNLMNQEKRVLCLNLILQWKKDIDEKVNLDCVDYEGNTALHNAAASGLKNCVEILVSHGASLFIENKSSETVCDMAEKNKHEDIAQYLETKMLFYSDSSANVPISIEDDPCNEEVRGLRAQDLQEAKDQLLVETSDMFHVPLFTAEVLLRKYEWSRQALLDAWMKDPVTCCKEVGISPPSSALQFSPAQDTLKKCCEQIQNEYQNESLNSPSKSVSLKEEVVCGICTLDLTTEDIMQIPCTHVFCKECWEIYLTSKIKLGEAHNILCPAYDCSFVIPVDVIEKLVSSDMVKRYLQFDIKAFVESNPSMKWCPYPGCARAVQLPDIDKTNEEILAISFSAPPKVSHSVDCGNGHYFCWECLGEAHAPCGCEKWKEWHKKVAEIKPQELKNTYSESEKAENCLWMVTNSKPCPNCKSPIQRNEGCNHMKCLKCRHDFCWVCLDPWRKHNISTGGFFRCNRYEALKLAEVKAGEMINEATEHNKQMRELKRFLQYFTRFKNHENSYMFEENFLKTIQSKVDILAVNLRTEPFQYDLSFLEKALYELLRARRVLCGTYVYGYYLEDNGYNATIFEYLQTELEESSSKLADALIRVYIQTPHTKIIQLAATVKKNRQDLLQVVNKGLIRLIPPETPPGMRKRRRHLLPGLMGLDPVDDPLMNQALLDSIKTLDPNDPWIINQNGKHTNVAALCDWPDYDSDGDVPVNPILSSVLGVCSREGCKKPRAKNQRTGEIHEFCSLSCKHWDVIKGSETSKVTAVMDPVIENLIALELSKLTHIQSSSDDPHSTANYESAMEGSNVQSEDDQPSSEIEEEFTSVAEEVCDISLPCLETNEIATPESNPETSQDTSTLNYYLKSSEENTKNLNTQLNNNFSKADKDLFKNLNAVTDTLPASPSEIDEGIS